MVPDTRADHGGEKSFDLEKAQAEAVAHVDDVEQGAASIKDDLIAHAEAFTDEEIRILKNKEALPPELVSKIIDGVLHFTRRFYEASPDKLKLPPAEELPYTFIFRFALCAYLHALRWIIAGGAKDRKMERFGNDMVDITIAAYGTCFDGVMSDDKQTNEIYDNAMFLLNKVIFPYWKKKKAKNPEA